MKKYIAPGAWFSIEYPSHWTECEDTENSFLFFDPDQWSGNFRISAFRGEDNKYAQQCINYECAAIKDTKIIYVGEHKCGYLATDFEVDGKCFTSHHWVTGKDDLSIECSFTVDRGHEYASGEKIVESLQLNLPKDIKEVIPARVLEISAINEAYEWAASAIKKQLTKDFTAQEEDVASIQKVIDCGKYKKEQRNVWEALGVAFGSILVNEMDGMKWVAQIEIGKEVAALRFADSNVMVYPFDLIWQKVKKGEKIDLAKEYARIKDEVETFLQK